MRTILFLLLLGVAAPASANGLISQGRSFHLRIPPGHDPNRHVPLVILLHGFNTASTMQSLYMGLDELADSKDFLYAYLDGTRGPGGAPFWNATDACCQMIGFPVDDVAFIRGVIDAVSATPNKIDENRIFVVGHSNGGFMAHRIACEEPRVAAFVSLAGAQWFEAKRCPRPGGGKVSVLQLHGTNDWIVPYWGGIFGSMTGMALHPSANGTIEIWAARNGCGPLGSIFGTLDLDASVPGAETDQQRSTACPAGIDVELWTMNGSGHVPLLRQAQFAQTIFTWLSAHPKVH